MSKSTILIGLNEINFDYIKYYIDRGHLPNFKKLLASSPLVETDSEKEYKLLEPWIQWVTIHTGKTYEEHQVFRLGDIVEHQDLPQLFEELESKGKKVGAVSPFNADNRLKNASFFIPDPWTKTSVTGNGIMKSLYQAIHQSVNDNAKGKISISTLMTVALGMLIYVPFSRWTHYLKLVAERKNPGVKAIILDSLLSDVFIKIWKKKKPDFANLFLNSGAHIQHHYLFNSTAYQGDFVNPEWYCQSGYDPLIKILSEYDTTIGKLMNIKDAKLIIATGLHQQPHKHLTFYWRLKDHDKFMELINLKGYKHILPRMSRDFLIEFDTEKEMDNCQALLESFYCKDDNEKIFEVDRRSTSLFVELIYPNELTDETTISSNITNQTVSNFKRFVAFVAIKNGEHNGTGYLVSNVELTDKKRINLTEVKDIIVNEVMSA